LQSASLTALTLQGSTITSVEDLQGVAVGTSSDQYTKALAGRGVAAVNYPWLTVEDEQAMIDKVKSGAIKALVIDTPVLSMYSASDCEVTIVGEEFLVMDKAVGLPANFSNSLVLKVSR
jgi:ABC-type amino acid transport substrate-binding protein